MDPDGRAEIDYFTFEQINKKYRDKGNLTRLKELINDSLNLYSEIGQLNEQIGELNNQVFNMIIDYIGQSTEDVMNFFSICGNSLSVSIQQASDFVSVNSSLNYSTHSPRILKGVISMFQGSSLFQSSAV